MRNVQKMYKPFMLILLLSMATFTRAITPSPVNETVYKEWFKLGESTTHIDVFARMVKCTTVSQVHLMIFNESTTDQLVQFTVEVINDGDGKKLTKNISFSTTMAAIYKAECGSDTTLNALKIDLPEGYDPAKLTLNITFKP